jgi:hypothetical protein
MKRVILKRFAYTPLGTFGLMTVEGTDFECFTVEEVWRGNKPNVSCVPIGNYGLVLSMHGYSTGRPYSAYRLVGVPGRSLINIHVANTIDDIEGCIGLGEEFGCVLSNKSGRWLPAVIRSRTAFRRFMSAMEGVPEGSIEIMSLSQKEWP